MESTVREDGLYCFKDFHPQVPYSKSSSNHNSVLHNSSAFVSAKSCFPPYLIWHFRLGHPHQSVVNFVLQSCNIQHVNKNNLDFCNACCLAKSHKLPSVPSQSVYNNPLDLVFMDV